MEDLNVSENQGPSTAAQDVARRSNDVIETNKRLYNAYAEEYEQLQELYRKVNCRLKEQVSLGKEPPEAIIRELVHFQGVLKRMGMLLTDYHAELQNYIEDLTLFMSYEEGAQKAREEIDGLEDMAESPHQAGEAPEHPLSLPEETSKESNPDGSQQGPDLRSTEHFLQELLGAGGL